MFGKFLAAGACSAIVFTQAAASSSGYQFGPMTDGARAATVAINTDQVTAMQEVAVSLTVGDRTGTWLTIGVQNGWGLPLCTFIETGHQPNLGSRHCIKPVAYQQRVALKLTFSYTRGWVAWIDGKPVGSIHLAKRFMTAAFSEQYDGGKLLDYYLNPVT